jgi:hypothetical protein
MHLAALSLPARLSSSLPANPAGLDQVFRNQFVAGTLLKSTFLTLSSMRPGGHGNDFHSGANCHDINKLALQLK